MSSNLSSTSVTWCLMVSGSAFEPNAAADARTRNTPSINTLRTIVSEVWQISTTDTKNYHILSVFVKFQVSVVVGIVTSFSNPTALVHCVPSVAQRKKHSVNHRLRSRRVFCTVLIFLMFFSQLFIQNPKSCAMTETKVDQCSPSNAQTMISCRPAFANGFFQCKELHGLQSSRLGISR